MMQFGILIMTTYFTYFAASSGPQLSVMQYPGDASVLLNSTVWMPCVFEYPSEENEEPVVYWRKGPDCHNQQSLQSSPSTGGTQPEKKGRKSCVRLDLKCKDCTTSDKIWWVWCLLLGYTIFVTTFIIAFGIHQCHTKCKNKLRNKDISTTMQSEWIYDQPSRLVNNGFSQVYEDMSIIRSLCDMGREMI